jgi:hypothetical protein
MDTNTPIKKISLDIRFIDPRVRIKEDRTSRKTKKKSGPKTSRNRLFFEKTFVIIIAHFS